MQPVKNFLERTKISVLVFLTTQKSPNTYVTALKETIEYSPFNLFVVSVRDLKLNTVPLTYFLQYFSERS